MPSNSRYPNVSGKDKNKYIYRVNDMMGFLVGGLGKPDLTDNSPTPTSFHGKQGIILFQGGMDGVMPVGMLLVERKCLLRRMLLYWRGRKW